MPVTTYRTTKLEYTVPVNGTDQTASERWLAVGSVDEDEVSAALLADVPNDYGDLKLMSLRPSHLGGGVWEATAEYGTPDASDPVTGPIDPANPDQSGQQQQSDPDDDEPLGPEYTVSITAGTQHVTQSLRTVHAVGRVSDESAVPGHRGTIGVSKDGVEGCDVFVPQMEWSVTRYVQTITLAYLRRLRDTVGKTNKGPSSKPDAKFYGFPRGELLFMGAEISKFVAGKGWPITFKFSAGKNLGDDGVGFTLSYKPNPFYDPDETIPNPEYDPEDPESPETIPNPDYDPQEEIPDLIVPEKRAWDYLWVSYGDEEDADNPGTPLLQRPQFAYVERVYEEADFRANLGI